MGEIIYKKQFHREPIDKTEPEVANFTDSGNAPSFDEIMKEIYSNVTYLVLPGREKKARNFIQKAIEISNDYELDIEIREHLSHISVTYTFDCCAGMGFLKSIIEMADDISFLTISAATIWSCPSTFIQRQYSKEDGLFSPNGQT